MKWSVGMKIAGGFGLALLMLAIIGVVSYRSTQRLIHGSEEVLAIEDTFNDVDELIKNLQTAVAGQRGYLITGEDHYLEPFQQASNSIREGLEHMKGQISTAESADTRHLRGLFDTLEPKVRSKMNDLEETIRIRRTQGYQAALRHMLSDKGENQMNEIRQLAEQMENEQRDSIKASMNQAQQSGNLAMLTTIYGSLIAFLFVGIAATVITRGIANPLKEMAGVATQISSGDLRSNITPGTRHDEVGVLAHSFARMTEYLQEMAQTAGRIAANDLTIRMRPVADHDVLGTSFVTMTQNIRTMIMETQEATSVLAAAVSEMAASTSQLAASSSQTATAVSETTTTIEEVRQTTQVATQKAKSVSENAQQASAISRTGRSAVEESLHAMERIRQQMELIAESIVQLSEQSQSIGEIIATVNDLAEQSNLLAVNAAIEAAKAGEQGRGFAVVAQEVRSLAEQSKQATTRVRSILNDIQKATSATVMATEQGSKAVDSGMRQVSESGESIRLLAETIDISAQSALQITRSSEEQLVGVDQVASAMENIKQASMQNMDSAKQVESAARNLHELGQKLKQIVSHYSV